MLPFATTWINLEGIMLSEISQTERDKYSMLLLICGSQKIKQMHITKQKQMHRYREQTSGYQWGKGKGDGQDRGRGLRGTDYYV